MTTDSIKQETCEERQKQKERKRKRENEREREQRIRFSQRRATIRRLAITMTETTDLVDQHVGGVVGDHEVNFKSHIGQLRNLQLTVSN